MRALMLGLLVACEPLNPVGVENVSALLGLSGEQEAWLLSQVKSEAIDQPEDLLALPGAGAELREALAGELCWAEPWEAGMVASGLMRTEWAAQELRGMVSRPSVSARIRLRRAHGLQSIHGGIRIEAGPAVMAAGGLSWGTGLGGFWVSPGGQQSGNRPVRPASGRLRESWSAGGIEPGIAAAWGTSSRVVALWFPGSQAMVLNWRRRGSESQVWTASAGHVLGELGLQGAWEKRTLTGGVYLEASMWSGRWCWVGAWQQRVKPFHFRGSLHWAEAEFGHPLGWAQLGPGSAWGVEALWRPGGGGSLRLAAGSRHREQAPWPDGRGYQELGGGIPLGSGFKADLTWRRTAPRELEAAEPYWLFRADLSRKGHYLVALRGEERIDGAGRTGLLGLRWGRPGQWEFRGSVVAQTGSPAVVRSYRRMPSSIYPWVTLRPGAWFGGWKRWSWNRMAVESSLDWAPQGWEAALALIAGATKH